MIYLVLLPCLIRDVCGEHARGSHKSQCRPRDKSSRIPLLFIKLYGVFTTFAAGALITAPLPNVMKKLFPAISSCNINYETRKVPGLYYFFCHSAPRQRNFTIQLLQNGEGRLFHPRMVLIRVCRVIQAVKELKTSRSQTGLAVLWAQFGLCTKEMLTSTDVTQPWTLLCRYP